MALAVMYQTEGGRDCLGVWCVLKADTVCTHRVSVYGTHVKGTVRLKCSNVSRFQHTRRVRASTKYSH